MKFQSLNYFAILLLIALFCFASCKSSKEVNKKNKKRVETVDKTKGKKDKGNDKVSVVIKAARSYTGTPYKYGGTTRSGMDCSALLMNSFKAANINLPRTSELQSKYGKPVRLEELKKGDLVFFSGKKGSKKIKHVGMVTEVKGKKDIKFIHASTKLGVVESDLYAPYYISIYVKAMRPF